MGTMNSAEKRPSWPVGPALVTRVEAAIHTFRAADPFLPVHILVPNHVLGTLLSRALFADTGYLAIHVELPHEFAWSVASRDSLAAGLLTVPEEVDLAIVLEAAAAAVSEASTPDYLKLAVPMPGFAPAALRTLRDIAAGLGLHQNEAAKYVGELLSQGIIVGESMGNQLYYRARTDNGREAPVE